MKRSVFSGMSFVVFMFCWAGFVWGGQEVAQGTPVAYFPAPAYTFDGVFEGASVPHDFVIQNKGTGALDVKRVAGG